VTAPFPSQLLVALALLGAARPGPGQTEAPAGAEAKARPLTRAIARAIEEGEVVGAQLAIGDRRGVRFEKFEGTRGPADPAAVDRQTRFCIGSCSKPFTAACLLAMAEEKKIRRDVPIDRWLPEFKGQKLRSGEAAPRAPTLDELLAHRGGLYSQREEMSPRQKALIRDFKQTLEASVRGIAAEPLLARPGTRYAYSGAGYCVAGRVAEVVEGAPFASVFRDRIASPLGLRRTGYFFPNGEANVAVGGRRKGGRTVPHPDSPHLLGPDWRFALVGGSLYSTARETGRFARMVLNQGRLDGTVVLSKAAWGEFTRPKYDGGTYGLGWSLTAGKDGEVTRLEHNGSLAGYRSLLLIDLAKGWFLVLHWTVVRPPREKGRDEVEALQPLARKALAAFSEGGR
jgi:CubicO group peptidase (beta-lactamase class C family)